MLTNPDDTDRRTLDRAATLLDRAGSDSQDRHGSEVAIHCLIAADLLASAGANSDLPTGEALGFDQDKGQRLLIATALQLLGGLDEFALDDDRVLDAIQHALLAHAATA